MIYDEAFDYLWAMLANAPTDTGRTADYQRKRLRRALLGRALKPYFLEVAFRAQLDDPAIPVANTQTLPVGKPLIVIDGALRTNYEFSASSNQFAFQLLKGGGNARVQILQDFIKDEHMLTPFQCAIRSQVDQHGPPWPLTWPVPIRLETNEVLQVKTEVLPGSNALVAPNLRTTFVQFRAVMTDNQKADDALIEELTKYILDNPLQRSVFLPMATDDRGRSIILPDVGTSGQVDAKTRETEEHLLVLGYSVLFARTNRTVDPLAAEMGTQCDPKWRLQSSDGHAFSRELIDLNCFAYAQPDGFWQAFPVPFLLPKGSSLSAQIEVPPASTALPVAGSVANLTEKYDNYLIFRCVTV